jgi:hypothetical protein
VKEPFVIERSRTARSSPEVVLSKIRDPSSWPAWQPEIVSTNGPSRLDEGAVVVGSARMLGFGVSGRSAAVEVNDHTFEEQVIVGVALRVRFDVRPSDEGVVITQSLSTELPTGPAGRALGMLLRWRLRRMQRVMLDRLARQAEDASVS